MRVVIPIPKKTDQGSPYRDRRTLGVGGMWRKQELIRSASWRRLCPTLRPRMVVGSPPTRVIGVRWTIYVMVMVQLLAVERMK